MEPDFKGAKADLDAGVVSLWTLLNLHASVTRGIHRKFKVSDDNAAKILSDSTKAFEEKWGPIAAIYRATGIMAGCLRTDGGLIFVEVPPQFADSPHLTRTMGNLSRIMYRVSSQLKGPLRTQFSRRLFAVATSILDEIQNEQTRSSNSSSAAENWREIDCVLEDIEEDYYSERTQDFTNRYLGGAILASFVGFAVPVGGLAAINAWLFPYASWFTLGLMMAFGSLGGATSVAIRFAKERADVEVLLDDDHSVLKIMALGAARPGLGALFGLLLLLLVRSGYAPLAVPADATTALYFLSALSYLAGFGERLISGIVGIPRGER